MDIRISYLFVLSLTLLSLLSQLANALPFVGPPTRANHMFRSAKGHLNRVTFKADGSLSSSRVFQKAAMLDIARDVVRQSASGGGVNDFFGD